jgi:hypothetical protein
MFSGAAKIMNVVGGGNNCRPVTREEFRTSDPSSMFLLPSENPYVILRSPLVTHVFTDVAYIQFEAVNGNPAKRFIRRLDYAKYDISNVFFETSGGGMDFDCTLMFTVNGNAIRMDIVSDQQPFAARVYVCLVALCRQQQKNLRYLELSKGLPNVSISIPPGVNPAEALTTALGGWVHHCVSSYDPENYAVIFQQYFP